MTNPTVIEHRKQVLDLLSKTEIPQCQNQLSKGPARCLIGLVGEQLMGLDLSAHDRDPIYAQVADWLEVGVLQLLDINDPNDSWSNQIEPLTTLFELNNLESP